MFSAFFPRANAEVGNQPHCALDFNHVSGSRFELAAGSYHRPWDLTIFSKTCGKEEFSGGGSEGASWVPAEVSAGASAGRGHGRTL